MLEQFCDYLKNEKRYSNHTVIAYRNDIQQFFLSLPNLENDISLVTTKVIRHYLVELVEEELENTTINRKLSTLNTFFKFLKRQKIISANPMIKTEGLKIKKRLPQFVPENQLWDKSTFTENEDPFENQRDELILELFYQTGIRLDELINLKESNINQNYIKVLGKRNKERLIPISIQLFDLIQNYRSLKIQKESKFLINTKNGEKVTPKFVYTKVNYYLGKTTNLKKKSPHVLRHTFATHMLNNGATLESIKKLLGHTDMVATQVYTHNTFKQVKKIYKSSHPRGGS